MRISTESDADIRLLPGRAALVTASRTLLVADLHLGKAAAFRRAGIPVPEGSAQRDLERLERLVAEHCVARVVVLGDLFHAKGGCTERVFEEFRGFIDRIGPVGVVLVLGNHDRGVGRLPDSLGLTALLPAIDEPPFHFVHEPASAIAAGAGDSFVIGGHLHPTLAIRGPRGDRIADRCFVADPALLVLPAFGSFTGGHAVQPAPDRRLWIARDDAVVDVTRMASLAARL
jgi:DNA ligase-associated metallophosphoesterase